VLEKLCTIKNVVRAIVAVYVIATLSQLTMFVDKYYPAVVVPSLVDGPNVTVVGCVKEYASFVLYNMNVYFNVYYWFRVIFIHLVPCSILIVLNALLVRTMRQAQRRRRQLLAQNRKSECRRLAERNMTTMMLVVVVGVFLLAELPNALLFIVMIIDNTWELQILTAESSYMAPLLLNLFILLSYPLNFFIYCAMSRQFRDAFRELCCLCCGGATAPAQTGTEATTMYVTVALNELGDDGGAGSRRQSKARKPSKV